MAFDDTSLQSKASAVDVVQQKVQHKEVLGLAVTEVQHNDEIDLARFGKKQRFKRKFGIVSIVGLVCTLMVTWEAVLILLPQSLSNGGPEGAVCAFIFVWVGTLLQCLILAELGSMMPLAGGQYNWVAILAPRSCSKLLSYITGWVTAVAWQGAMASGMYLGASVLQGLAVLNHPTFSPERWQSTLVSWAILSFSLMINTWFARSLQKFETAVLILHILGFFALLIPLVVMAPKSSTHDVFEVFINAGGWPTDGISFMIGTAVTMLAFGGIDGATHLAEEIENASVVIPRSMLASVFINGSTGFALLIAVLYCAGDIDAALSTPTGQPFLEIYRGAVRSSAGATILAVIVLLIIIFCETAWVATTSRMFWAFARERGVPGHQYIAKVKEGAHPLPLNAIFATVIINALLALINIGSTAAFNAFTSLTVSGFYASFTLAACCLLWRQVKGMPLKRGPFGLGKMSLPINVCAIAYSIIGAFFSFWPQAPDPNASTMNWAIVVWAGVLLGSLIYWALRARKTYTGPIMEVALDSELHIREV